MVLNTIYPSEEDTSANFRDELTSDEESSIGDSAIESSGALDNRCMDMCSSILAHSKRERKKTLTDDSLYLMLS